MKPLGKCLKTAHYNKEDKTHALNELLSTYRATPHSTTGIAPGDILFRHGYTKDFPNTHTPDNTTVREALTAAHGTRDNINSRMNQTRRDEHLNIGDTVLTKNNKHTKFQPQYGPTPMTITELEGGGVTCTSSTGTTQRRHLDDVKLIPTNATMNDTDNTNTAEEQHTAPPTTPLREDPNTLTHPSTTTVAEGSPITDRTPTTEPPATGYRRSTRNKHPNPRYKDFVLNKLKAAKKSILSPFHL